MAATLTPTKRLRAGSRRDPRTYYADRIVRPTDDRDDRPMRPGKTAEDRLPRHERNRVLYASLLYPADEGRHSDRYTYLLVILGERHIDAAWDAVADKPQRRRQFMHVRNPAVVRL